TESERSFSRKIRESREQSSSARRTYQDSFWKTRSATAGSWIMVRPRFSTARSTSFTSTGTHLRHSFGFAHSQHRTRRLACNFRGIGPAAARQCHIARLSHAENDQLRFVFFCDLEYPSGRRSRCHHTLRFKFDRTVTGDELAQPALGRRNTLFIQNTAIRL